MSAERGGGAVEKLWYPLESNPASLNQYISRLGFDTNHYEFVDVFSTEQWALEMVPQPVCAVMVLLPMTEGVLRKRRELRSESASIECNDVWYTKQRVRNACGTIAIMHALANTPEAIRESSIRNSSWLHQFLQKYPASASPADIATALETDTTIEEFHEAATHDNCNQTSRGNREDTIDMHFVSFVHVGGMLFELDGRLDEGPICHGITTQTHLLADACRVVKQLMEADPTEMRFSIVALAPKLSRS